MVKFPLCEDESLCYLQHFSAQAFSCLVARQELGALHHTFGCKGRTEYRSKIQFDKSDDAYYISVFLDPATVHLPSLRKVQLELANDLGGQAADFDCFQEECCGGANISPEHVDC